MPSVTHYQHTYKHSIFDLIPEKYRDTVKASLLVLAGLVTLSLLVLLS